MTYARTTRTEIATAKGLLRSNRRIHNAREKDQRRNNINVLYSGCGKMGRYKRRNWREHVERMTGDRMPKMAKNEKPKTS